MHTCTTLLQRPHYWRQSTEPKYAGSALRSTAAERVRPASGFQGRKLKGESRTTAPPKKAWTTEHSSSPHGRTGQKAAEEKQLPSSVSDGLVVTSARIVSWEKQQPFHSEFIFLSRSLQQGHRPKARRRHVVCPASLPVGGTHRLTGSYPALTWPCSRRTSGELVYHEEPPYHMTHTSHRTC